MTMPTNTPMVSDEYTSFVMSARASASSGGTIDHAPVLISSKASSISLPFLKLEELVAHQYTHAKRPHVDDSADGSHAKQGA